MWHEFQVLLDAAAPTSQAFGALAERIGEGVDADTALAARDGVSYVEVYREAASLDAAIHATLTELEALGIDVVRVAPDPLVTASEIGERLGVTRQAVQSWIAGKRGKGGFPTPLIGLESRIRLWRWLDVLEWLGDRPDALADAQVIHRVNHALDGLRMAR